MSEQQHLSKIHFEKLKCINNMTFSLEGKEVTGIFGPNGCGKSTILHTLLCLYKPKDPHQPNYRFSNFFISVDRQKWIGSKFSYEGSFTEGGIRKTFNRNIHKKGNRWLKNYNLRPDRNVFFIGINTCLPDVESEKAERIHLNPAPTSISNEREVLRIASDVMNFNYEACNYRGHNKKKYLNCKNGLDEYISLSMGAGEQRLFRMLEVIVNAPRYSLIVIDEIDLTLHNAALSKLINHIVRFAADRHHQFVFTSHRQELALRDDINIRHIVQTVDGVLTQCFEQTTPECVERLTGNAVRPLTIMVEDNVAKAIVNAIAQELDLKSKIEIHTYGDASNAFNVISGLSCSGKFDENIIAVTDGDCYHTSDERTKQMRKSLSGNEVGKEELRQQLLHSILQFNLPENKTPDEYLHQMLTKMPEGPEEDNELLRAAKAIVGVYDKHQKIKDIGQQLGDSDEIILNRIMTQLKRPDNVDNWVAYTDPIRVWLQSRKAALNL